MFMFNFDVKNLSNDDLLKLFFEMDSYVKKLEKDINDCKNMVMNK